ncbi:hypothetical protein [Flavobacterium sp. ov086]|uniref:hypothetical protein n=1 Tax=Flavobacterium sp. ov086 TaxID=1761785 RepID=UPI000B686054|nr:hypothetical protein [Flavobacterium sp. ov086]SNR47539.1 hypothetical protein SAMN04487979_10773 [Flavobacterium sp. ov086]
MESSEIILNLLIGGLLGLVGQMLRFLVGYKKLYDVASKENIAPSEMFDTSRFVISLIIGFVAGVVGVASLWDFKATLFGNNPKETVMTLIGIGYAGTDFIEGFIKKSIPSNTTESVTNDGKAPTPGASEQPG